ncbi:MAG TPA: DUF2007 domain-containing protein [Candidatus Binatia bacterium]|nr:DUF2007 domain-containing protein [Candidatus Binatia bacterium]
MNNITITTVLNPAEAGLICSRLEAAGFHPFMPDENTAFNMEGYTLAIGGIRIQVPEIEAANAREFLAAPAE